MCPDLPTNLFPKYICWYVSFKKKKQKTYLQNEQQKMSYQSSQIIYDTIRLVAQITAVII